MKKTFATTGLLAAVLLSCGAVQAQNVTLFGIVDEFVTLQSTDGKTYKRLESGGLLGSRVGFRGSEDLGDGLKANFLLEAGLNADNGTQSSPTAFFNRQSWVGLSGSFGDVRLGLIPTSQFFMSGQWDAFDGATIGSGLNSIGFYFLRFGNSATYTTPQLGPVKARVQLSLNETNSGRRFAAMVGALEYQDGPLYLGANYAESQNATTLVVTKASFLGGNYETGPVKLFFGFNHAGSSNRFFNQDGYSVSASYRSSDRLALAAGFTRCERQVRRRGRRHAHQRRFLLRPVQAHRHLRRGRAHQQQARCELLAGQRHRPGCRAGHRARRLRPATGRQAQLLITNQKEST